MCVCIKFRFRLLKWDNWYVFTLSLCHKYKYGPHENGGLQFYRRNKFWTTTTVQKGKRLRKGRPEKVKQGCKAIDKVTHQTPGGGGTFRQVLDQATENRKIRHKDLYQLDCLWSLIKSYVICYFQWVSMLCSAVLWTLKNSQCNLVHLWTSGQVVSPTSKN